MSAGIKQFPTGAVIYPLPRPVPDWAAQILEFTYLLGATLWMGVHASAALLTAPLAARSPEVSIAMGRLLVWLLESLGYVAAIASGILLLAVLGMHLFALRRPVTILLMLSLVLVMTALAVGPQLWLIPKVASQLRLAELEPDAAAGTTIREALLLAIRGMGLMGLLHLFFGAILVTLGARRCYRYPRDEMAQFSPPVDP
jgi:hypothetical protein